MTDTCGAYTGTEICKLSIWLARLSSLSATLESLTLYSVCPVLGLGLRFSGLLGGLTLEAGLDGLGFTFSTDLGASESDYVGANGLAGTMVGKH